MVKQHKNNSIIDVFTAEITQQLFLDFLFFKSVPFVSVRLPPQSKGIH